MQGFVRILRALALLVGVWGVIALVGWLTDAFPPSAMEAKTGAPEAAKAGSKKAKKPEKADAGAKKASPDAGPSKPAVPPKPRRTAARYTTCDPTVAAPSLSVGQMVGDPRPEIAVGCGPLVQVLGVTAPTAGALMPVRVLAFEAPPEEAGVSVDAAPAVAADVDGDSSPDLLLGFTHARAGGGTSGGALYLVRAEPTGAFARPDRLAPIAAARVVAADLDGKAGADVAALNRANAFARRPSEVWVFGGGPTPERIAQLRTGVGGEDLAAADLDGDGHLDLVAMTQDPGRVDAFFGDGSGRFPRSATLALAAGRALTSGDLDGDGRSDVLVLAQEGLAVLAGGAADTLEQRPIPTPEGFAQPRIVDVDGDGLADLLGITGPRVVWLRRTSTDLVFEPGELASFDPVPFAVRAVELADLDADGHLDAVILGRANADAPWEVVAVPNVGTGVVVELPDAAEPIADAPLTLQIAP